MVVPKISAQQQRKIEIMLAKWVGKLTWDALVAKVELELGIKTTRQTLCTYVGINTYYKNKKLNFVAQRLPLHKDNCF